MPGIAYAGARMETRPHTRALAFALALAVLPSAAWAQGFNSGGFNSGGFGTQRGFNAAGFNSAPLPAAGALGGMCGRMLVPAASLAMVSRGFFPGHAGMDLVADTGAPVRAATVGVVAHVGRDDAYGNFVDIRHAGGISTRYGHLSAFAPALTAGATVFTGSVIGLIGATGNATGPHLHFEVRVSGVAVDPKPFLIGDNCPRGAPGRDGTRPDGTRPDGMRPDGMRPEILEARAPLRRVTAR